MHTYTKKHEHLHTHVHQETPPIGIGSILTAELCAINSALQWVLNTPKVLEYQRLFIFSDCQTAINLIYRRATPKGCFTLIQSIQEGMSRAREVIDTELLWVPAHVGVPATKLPTQRQEMRPNPFSPIFPSQASRQSPLQLQGPYCGLHLNEGVNSCGSERWLQDLAQTTSPIQAASRHSQSTRVLCWPKTRTSGLGTTAIGPVRSQPLEISLGARRRRGLRLWSPRIRTTLPASLSIVRKRARINGQGSSSGLEA